MGLFNSKYSSQYPVLEKRKPISFPQNGMSIQDIISTSTITSLTATTVNFKT
jgi:hypothetical protein